LVFTGVNFLETIKADNEEHAKRIRKCVKQYEEITKHHHRLNTVKCYFTHQADQIPLVSIFDLTKHISTFEKKDSEECFDSKWLGYKFIAKFFVSPKRINMYVPIF
jgi:DNA-binding transcriptional regulator WhiA